MRYVKHGEIEFVRQDFQLFQNGLAQVAIEAGQWFVEQEQPRFGQERTPDRDPLAFTARQFPNIATE